MLCMQCHWISFDPLGRPTITARSDHFSKSLNTNNVQVRIMLSTNGTVGQAVGIIAETCLALPDSIILKHRGIISVVKRKFMTSCSSVLTRAPITPRDVNLRYSKGLVFDTVCKNGYKYKGMWARRNADRVSGCEATHCSNARALQTLGKEIK